MQNKKKWLVVIILGTVLLILIGLLVFFAVKSCNAQETLNKRYYQLGTEIIEIDGANATVPPEAVIGYYSGGDYHEIQPDVDIPTDAELVYADPDTDPSAPTAPPSDDPQNDSDEPTDDSGSGESSDPDASTPTATPSDSGEDGGEFSGDDWDEENAIIVDFSELFGTPTP
ncbi:MAG: hypothetical protein Q4C04_07055 [Clostridia bacterium]|nr:hypothetical protein [Clostridia bacterium]